MPIDFELSEGSHVSQSTTTRSPTSRCARSRENTTSGARPADRMGRLLVERRPQGARRTSRRTERRLRHRLPAGRGALLGRRWPLPAHADAGARRLRRQRRGHEGAEATLHVALPRRGRHPIWGAMAITEPQAGSDAAAIETTADFDDATEEWILNGTKIFCTAGEGASTVDGGFVVVWATIDKSAGRGGIKSFVVPANTPGMELIGCEKKLGIRASDTATLRFENCRVPRRTCSEAPRSRRRTRRRRATRASRARWRPSMRAVRSSRPWRRDRPRVPRLPEGRARTPGHHDPLRRTARESSRRSSAMSWRWRPSSRPLDS